MTHPETMAAGRYVLLEQLGQGATSRVFKAWDNEDGAYRAIKVLEPGYAQFPVIRHRFETEARIFARLDHPRVLPIYDMGEDQDWLYMVMELVDAGSLADHLARDGPFSTERAIALMVDILDALSAAHAAGVVHRDIKPSNVLLGPDGHALVSDFGISRLVEDESLTQTGVMLGTLAYMAPEQRGNSRVGPEVDLYAAGATLFALVTAEEPFDLFAREIRERRLHGLDPTVAGIISRAVEYHPADRYSSADQMRRELFAAALGGLSNEGPHRLAAFRAPPAAWLLAGVGFASASAVLAFGLVAAIVAWSLHVAQPR